MQKCCEADACADGPHVGIGGWFTLSDSDPPQSGLWFALQLSPVDLPSEWTMREDAQRDIASYELLAQIVLVSFRGRFMAGRKERIAFRTQSDNTPTEGASNRLFTTAKPMAHLVQLLLHGLPDGHLI